MQKIWKIAIASSGFGGVGAFVFWSLYNKWLTLPIFSKLSSEHTFIIMLTFLGLTFLSLISIISVYLKQQAINTSLSDKIDNGEIIKKEKAAKRIESKSVPVEEKQNENRILNQIDKVESSKAKQLHFKERIKKIIELFGNQKVSGKLFNVSNQITLYPFEKISLLSESFVHIYAETKITEKWEADFYYDGDTFQRKAYKFYIVYLPKQPKIDEDKLTNVTYNVSSGLYWSSELNTFIEFSKSLDESSLLWLIINTYNISYETKSVLNKNGIMCSSSQDINFLEIMLKKH